MVRAGERIGAGARARAAAYVGAAVSLLATACGGGAGGTDGSATGSSPPPSGTGEPSVAQRSQAAQATAESSTNACAAIRPFYWEIGDAGAALASGSATAPGNATVYVASSAMPIASASKWLYAAYVVEKRAGAPTPTDIRYLHFQSGYTSFDAFGTCGFGDTVDSCLNNGGNGAYTAAHDGKFYYDGGHMQKHASLEGLGAMGPLALAAEVRSRLGSDVAMSYSQPQPAGGVVTTPADYARFLRKLLGGSLRLGALLGNHAVCTDPASCGDAVYTPTPAGEAWHYALGHWVDDDPVVGDGSFSSTGAFGFHPWIDAGKRYYGVIARRTALPGTGADSAACGRLIRKAWASGAAR